MKTARAGSINLDDARKALQEGTGAGVRVAVLDTGVETSHPALAGLTLADDVQIVEEGLQATCRPNDGGDPYGHGTAVTYIVHRLAPGATIGSFRVLGANVSSRSALIHEGVRQALAAGYQILNCSFGCAVAQQVLQYKTWIDEAYLKGVHLVAACNNVDYRRPEWPGFFPSVITVNMAKAREETAFYYVPGNLVEFAAAGMHMEVAWRNGQTHRPLGSSFAAPRLTGILARLLSAFPGLDPLRAKALLIDLAADWDPNLRGPNVTYLTSARKMVEGRCAALNVHAGRRRWPLTPAPALTAGAVLLTPFQKLRQTLQR